MDVDSVAARYSEKLKVEVLEKVFPKSYWTGENDEALEHPPEFDFLGNAGPTDLIVGEYRQQAKDDIHADCWAREFMKMYHVGERLQELGLHPKVSIG